MKRIAKDFTSLFKFPDLSAKLPVNVELWNFEDVVEAGKNYV